MAVKQKINVFNEKVLKLKKKCKKKLWNGKGIEQIPKRMLLQNQF